MFKRVIAHEDVLIRQRREMHADQLARGTGRGGVGNIKRSEDDPDLEHCEYLFSFLSTNSVAVVPPC